MCRPMVVFPILKRDFDRTPVIHHIFGSIDWKYEYIVACAQVNHNIMSDVTFSDSRSFIPTIDASTMGGDTFVGWTNR